MTISLAFWIIMLLWALGGAYLNRASLGAFAAGALLPFLAVLLLGWHTFGPPLR